MITNYVIDLWKDQYSIGNKNCDFYNSLHFFLLFLHNIYVAVNGEIAATKQMLIFHVLVNKVMERRHDTIITQRCEKSHGRGTMTFLFARNLACCIYLLLDIPQFPAVVHMKLLKL